MSGDDRIRNAYDDLARRTRAVDPEGGLAGVVSDARSGPGWWWAAVAAAAVVAIVGAAVALDLLPGTPGIPPVSDPETTTTTSVPSTATTTSEVTTTSLPPTTTLPPVTAEELPACSGSGVFAGEGAAPSTLSMLEAGMVDEGCHRVVVGFSEGIPTWFEAQGPFPLVVELPETTEVAPSATDADGVYAVRRPGGGLAILVMRPARETLVRALPERGMLVIDLVAEERAVPPSGSLVALTRPVQAAGGTVEAVGVARPFEANLGIRIFDADGEPVEAVFSGSGLLGTITTDAYAVQTLDWLEAWAPFAVRAEGLDPGEFVLVLDAEGGSDDPRTFEAPFSVEEGGPAVSAPSAEANDLAGAVLGFAGGGEPPPLADEVLLRLGNEVVEPRTAVELSEPEAWVIDAETFNAWSGPFDLLEPMRTRPHVRVTEGPIAHCAAPVIDWWPGVGVEPVNLEPVGVDSCLEWYAISLRVDGAGRISEVVLDLWEP